MLISLPLVKRLYTKTISQHIIQIITHQVPGLKQLSLSE